MKHYFSSILLLLTMHVHGQYNVKKLSAPVSTDAYNETCPVLSYDETNLYFTRVGDPNFNKSLIENNEDLSMTLDGHEYMQKLKNIYSLIAGRIVKNPYSSDFNQDIWISDAKGTGKIIHPGNPLNNALPNSICSNYSRDDEYVLINEFPIKGGISAGFSYTKRMENGTFTIPTPIEIIDFKEKGKGVNLSMSNDGQHIFIAMENRSNGNVDIYLSRKVINNKYSRPKRLGSRINSPYRESTPFISQDKRRLYFSSDRPGGIGGMDIYYSERLDYTYQNWSEPKLLGEPINSTSDDSYPYVSIDENTIHFASYREGTSDIYVGELYRKDFLDRPISVNINIINQNRDLIPGEMYWSEQYEKENRGFFRSNIGQYRLTLEKNIPMEFYAKRRGTESEVVIVDPAKERDNKKFEVDIYLMLTDAGYVEVSATEPTEAIVSKEPSGEDELEFNLSTKKSVTLKNIYFAKASPDVLEKSFPALKKLAAVLIRRPEITVRIEGHTDNIGVKKDLMELSWMRAEAIKKLLIIEGVSQDQVSTIGYGDSRPLTDNSTEEARKRNRRVEIRVID